MACVWCGYDTAAEGATRCAECGAPFGDRQRIERIADWASAMLGFSILGVVPACIGLLSLALESLGGKAVYSMMLTLLTIGFIRSIAVFRRLKQYGRNHRRRREAAIAVLIFLPQVLLYWIIGAACCVSMI